MRVLDSCPHHNDKLSDDNKRAVSVKGTRHVNTRRDPTPYKLPVSNLPQTTENVERSNDNKINTVKIFREPLDV